MSQKDCNCCTGIEALTPKVTANRPGLKHLVYRVGTQASFLETMLARLASTYVEHPAQDVKEWRLNEDDIRHIPRFALRLKQAGDPFTLFLRGQFSEELSQLLADYEGETEVPADLPGMLIIELNETLESVRLYKPELTGHLNLSLTIHNLGRQDSLTGDEFIRLNRLILEAAYPDLIIPEQRLYPLQALTTRSTTDPAIAMLDSWATVADVLTFYQERIANEGYLPTAAERRSILEMARLVGYKLRPGVAATVYLAFTMENGYVGEIPARTRAQSIPDPGETAQFFETEEALPAQAAWNEMQPRLKRPLPLKTYEVADNFPYIYFQGTDLNLNPGDALLFVEGNDVNRAIMHTIEEVEVQSAENRTRVRLVGAPKEIAISFISAIEQTANQYLDPEPYGVNADGETAQIVMRWLDGIITYISESVEADIPNNETAIHLRTLVNATLGGLTGQLENARRRHYTKLEPWLNDIVTNFTAVMDRYESQLMNELLGLTLHEVSHESHENGHDHQVGSDLTALKTLTKLDTVLEPISKPPSLPPRNAPNMKREVRQVLAPQNDIVPRMVKNLRPATADHLYTAWQDLTLTQPSQVKVYALRLKAAPFGHDAQLRTITTETDFEDKKNEHTYTLTTTETMEWELNTGQDLGEAEQAAVLWLDNSYEKILSKSWIVIDKPKAPTYDSPYEEAVSQSGNVAYERIITRIDSIGDRSRTDYGLARKSTRIELEDDWLADWLQVESNFSVIRQSAVYLQSEELTLAELPIETFIGEQEDDEEAGKRIELDGLYDGLEPGRWLVVSGEREDIKDEGETVAGIQSQELVMLAGVEQSLDETVPGEKPHTTLILANNLAYRYKRDTVRINANVAKASHGETISEVLGSGNGREKFQKFKLKRPPLTHLSAPTASGTKSTLEIHVNNIQWHEADNLAALDATSRQFISQTDDDGNTYAIFGNGERGVRLPTGIENVKSVYRSGIGSPGNVKANQIKLLATKPLGVKGVINPMRSSGGSDAEERDQARRNTPLPLLALDRLVSVQDYADFARSFAGVGKAQAAKLSDGQREVIFLTIAGEKDIPIDKNSDLYHNLHQALHQLGDPYQPIQIELRELSLIVLSARIKIHPDHLWEVVESEIRQTLLDVFSFERRNLGQDVILSEVYSTIQQIPGVIYADVDTFGAIPEKRAGVDGTRVPLSATQIALEAAVLILQSEPKGDFKDSRNEPRPYPGPLSSLEVQRPTNVPVLLPRIPINLADKENGGLRPAQIAYLSPDIPDTLMLTELST